MSVLGSRSIVFHNCKMNYSCKLTFPMVPLKSSYALALVLATVYRD